MAPPCAVLLDMVRSMAYKLLPLTEKLPQAGTALWLKPVLCCTAIKVVNAASCRAGAAVKDRPAEYDPGVWLNYVLCNLPFYTLLLPALLNMLLARAKFSAKEALTELIKVRLSVLCAGGEAEHQWWLSRGHRGHPELTVLTWCQSPCQTCWRTQAGLCLGGCLLPRSHRCDYCPSGPAQTS